MIKKRPGKLKDLIYYYIKEKVKMMLFKANGLIMAMKVHNNTPALGK